MKKIDNINFDAIKNGISELKQTVPPSQPKTRREVIFELADELKGLLQSGYSMQQVLELLGNNGIELKEGTLKNYLQRAGKQSKEETEKHSSQAHKASPVQSAKTENTRRRAAPKGKAKDTDTAQAAAKLADLAGKSDQGSDDGSFVIKSDEV